MAANPTPTNISELLASYHDAVRGCLELETEIGLKQNTAATMQAAWDAYQVAQTEVGRLKLVRDAARTEVREAEAAGERRIGCCRLRLVMLLGSAYSVAWGAAGFPDHSTQVPEASAKRSSLLTQLAGWFGHYPENESVEMGATAALCQQAHDRIRAAHAAVNQNKSALAVAVEVKDAAVQTLRDRYRSLIRELDIVLTEEDPRWRRFGLRMPAQPTMPQPVESLTAEALGEGRVQLTWPRAPQARRYRVQMRRAGEELFTNVLTVHDLEALLSDLTIGTDLDFRVLSANDLDECSTGPVTRVQVR